MIPFFRKIAFLLLFFSLSSPAFPQIYQWTDKDGNKVFSDTPPPGAEFKKVKVLKERVSPPSRGGVTLREEDPGSASPSASPSKEKREYRDIEVILYMTQWCPYSLRARAYLKSLGVNLIEYDVERDKGKNQERLHKTGGKSGVPVIDVEGIILKGYNANSIKKAVEKRRSM